MRAKHVDHIGIVVNDLTDAKVFFVDLGFTVVGETVIEGEWVGRITGLRNVQAEIVMVQAPDGQVNLELTKFRRPVDTSKVMQPAANTLGLRHIALVVDNIEAIVASLRHKGREVFGDIQNYEDIYKLCYVRGPEGIIVELAQRM